MQEVKVLDHGYVRLRNIAGPTRRSDKRFDAHDVDPANAARFSFDAADREDRPEEADYKLNNYLMRHGHNTPIEMITVWLEMQMPIFVARQFVRHRTVSINEVSARYTKLENLFYMPKRENIGVKAASNKQGRDTSDSLGPDKVEGFLYDLVHANLFSYRAYEDALRTGIPNELARCLLPLNIYTKWLWKQDLHNMMHFLALRSHKHAQFEAQEYARAIIKLLESELPQLMSLYRKYREQNDD